MIGALVPGLLPFVALAPQWQRATSPELFDERTMRTLDWPAHLPALTKGRLVVGDVTGDLQPDAVFLNGSTPVVMYAPAIHEALFEIAVPANDLALLPAALAGRPETLALVGSQGLFLLSDYSAGQFTVRSVGSAAWVGAERLRAADMDGDGKVDLVGLSAANELLFLHDPTGPEPLETSLSIGAAVLDFVPLDWHGDGSTLRVAVLTPTGLTVRSPGGAWEYALGGALDGGLLDVLRQSDLSFERLVLVYEASGGQSLLVLDITGTEAPVPLGTDTVFALAVADADRDRDQDLYLLHGVSHDTVLFLNLASRPSSPATFGFGKKKGELVDLAPDLLPPASWSAWPGLADLSLDGDPDLLVWVEATDQLVALENTRHRLARRQVQVLGGIYVFDEPEQHGQLRLNVSVPKALPFTPTHVEIVGWKEVHQESVLATAEPVAAVHLLTDLAGSLTVQCPIDLEQIDLYTNDIHYFDLRAVRVVDDTIVRAGPSAVHAFTTPESLIGELEAQFGPGTPLRVFVIEDPNSGEIELTAAELADRLLAPKEIKTDKIPLITSPPNPFE